MSERATAAPVSAESFGQGRTLAGLIDVLDRADAAPPGRRPGIRRASAHPAGTRAGAVRTVPLRSVQPAPMARVAASRASVVPEPDRAPVTRLADLVRRAAMWGAGPQGEYLAWPSRPARAAQAPPMASNAAARVAAPAALRRPGRIHRLVRRVAMWGAGPGGEYLAWGRPSGSAPRRDVDPPVVLREMPSTPVIQPVAPSPAAALRPRAPASSAGTRGLPPVPRGAVAVPGVRPSGPPERSRATGWPSQVRMSPAATGLVRARGDPVSCPVRGSPPPARGPRSPGSARSSFP